jgi:hypothetical protein
MTFALKTRTWLESVIRQRKLLIRINKSHKSEYLIQAAIEHLEKMLAAYRYDDDVNMARFIDQNDNYITMILPGSTASNYQKRREEFKAIRIKALLYLNQAPAQKQITKQVTYF